jgi:hypothetical protein
MKKSWILFVLCWLHFTGYAQFYQAIHGSNVAGSLSTHNNPASALSHPKPWDMTVMGFQIRTATNLFYLERYGYDSKDKQLLIFLKNGDFKKRLNSNINVNLLNARVRVSNRLSLGLGANMRMVNNARTSSYNFQDSLSDVNSFLLINDKNQPLQASIVNSSWLEVYGSMGYNLLETKRSILNAGINLKANKGLFGMAVNLDNVLFGRILPDYPVYQLNDINLKYVYSANTDQWDPSKPMMTNLRNYMGNSLSGGSLDLGMEWIIKDQRNIELFENRTQYNYTWKFGVSLLDVGFAQFKSGELGADIAGLKYSVNGLVLSQKFDSTVTDLAIFNDSAKTIAKQFSNIDGKFKIAHPTRFVVNIDKPITDNISINAELNLPVSLLSSKSNYSLQTLSSLTITPRMEGDYYGTYLPITFTGADNFWVGAAFKAGPLLIGLHNVLPFFQKMPYPNGGGYVAYVISPSEKLRNPKRKDIKCPD